MTSREDGIGAARMTVIVFGVWAALVGTYGRSAPMFPPAVRWTSGVTVAGICLFAALWPTAARYRWAFSVVAAFGVFSTMRTILGQPFDQRATVTAAGTYATLAMAAFGLSVMTAIVSALPRYDEEGDGWKHRA